jgi:hypothetical protein
VAKDLILTKQCHTQEQLIQEAAVAVAVDIMGVPLKVQEVQVVLA